jgi:mannose-6-phosphate isomerase-like protein (cupin superfamily)
MAFVIRQAQDSHFTRDLGGGTVSHRIITPKRDYCPIKVTKFIPKSGFVAGQDVVHDTDEFVYVLQGRIRITAEGFSWELGVDGSYYAPAGTATTFEALEDSRLLCIFVAYEFGPPPDED